MVECAGSMSKKELSPSVHAVLLLCFAALVSMLWMAPVLLAGFLHRIPALVLHAQELARTNVIDSVASPVAVVTFRSLAPLIGWENTVGWAMVTCVVMSISLLLLWWCIRRIFDVRIAWMAIAIYAFMPITWLDAVSANGYSFALFFLFLGCALYLYFACTRRLLAIALFGLCFGLTFSSAHAFVTFLPWVCLALLWHNRMAWKTACVEIASFLVLAYAGTMLPVLPNALQSDLTLVQRVQVFLPQVSEHGMTSGHLYPDNYVYDVIREEYDAFLAKRNEGAHFLTRQQDKYVHWNFGIGDIGFIGGIQNGFWLFLHTFPELLVQEYLGGAFLWIFILVGMVYMYQTKRSMLVHFVGLWFLMEFVLRFVLHYGRTHLMDIGWGFATLAALGGVVLCDSYTKSTKRISTTVCCSILAALMAVQLAQANRKLFARLYERSTVQQTFAAKEVLAALPEDAIIAHPRKEYLFFYSNRHKVSINPDTIAYLKDTGRVGDPFEYYGVTHIFGYSEEDTDRITRAYPSVTVVPLPEPAPVPVTPVTRYVLHLIR